MNQVLRHFGLSLGLAVLSTAASAAGEFAPGPSSLSQDENPTVLRMNLGAGVAYEFQSLDGVLLTGSGPSAELNLEFKVSKRRAWGLEARYRRMSLLGPDVSVSGATIQQLSNFDLTLFGRFGWLDLFAGAEKFSGKLFVIDSGVAGRQLEESKYLPVGGFGVLFYSTRRLKGRLQGIGSYGEAYGYSLTSLRVNASLQVAFP